MVAETHDRPEKIDHVWMDLKAGDDGLIRIALSTCSRQGRAAGLDPRIWLGSVRSVWSELPTPGVFSAPPLDYAKIEAASAVNYIPYERTDLENLLIHKGSVALRAEVWGELYVRGHAGVHQVHSRRPSFAVPEGYVGRDGALQFYERDSRELLLFKFAEQP